MPIAEVALTGVLIECCVGTELWALRARTGVDGVLRDVLPLSLGFVACIWHLNVFFFQIQMVLPASQGYGSQLRL